MKHRSLRDLEIVRLGKCSGCGEWIELSTSGHSIPEHKRKGSKRKNCVGSRYSYTDLKYRIDTPEQAVGLAQIIKEDTTKCLSGYEYHTLGCGDGNHCAQERRRRAQALAEYLLQHVSV